MKTKSVLAFIVVFLLSLVLQVQLAKAEFNADGEWEFEDHTPKVNVNGKELGMQCNTDSDCISNICEHRVGFSVGSNKLCSTERGVDHKIDTDADIEDML